MTKRMLLAASTALVLGACSGDPAPLNLTSQDPATASDGGSAPNDRADDPDTGPTAPVPDGPPAVPDEPPAVPDEPPAVPDEPPAVPDEPPVVPDEPPVVPDDDPPIPTEPCGKDLDVHNGTVVPTFGTPGSGGAFDADPLAPGPLDVVLEDATLDNPDPRRNTISATAYGPSTDGASLDAGPFPLVVVLPGFSTRHGAYRHFTDHLVSHGFAVLGVTPANVGFTDTPNNPANVAEIERAIQWAFEQSLLSGKLDATRMAVAGHSQGGKLAFFTAATDDRFSVVIGWDPQNGGGAPCFVAGFTGQDCNGWPVAPSCDTDRDFQDPGMLHNLRAETLVFAARDTAVTPDQHLWAEHFYRGAPSPASLLLFPAAGHGDWGGAGATTDLTKRVQLALLLTRFMGKRGLERYLPEGEAVSEDASVMVFTK